MTSPTATAPRDTGRRAGLDHDEVVAAALGLVEADGADALTMRKLAAELGVTTTTIYWHVGGRDELVDAVIRRQSAHQAALPITGATARERVASVAGNVWRSALDHRNVTALAHQAGATSLLNLPMERALARELHAAGVVGTDARDAVRAIFSTVAGFLVIGLRRTAGTRAESLWLAVDDPELATETVTAMQEPPDLPHLFERTLAAVVASFVPEETS